eukprot:6194402-Pleurochrysis_carterae.AAC.1
MECAGLRSQALLPPRFLLFLAQVMTAERVYRGVSGGMLPDEFWVRNEWNVAGGVEFAFMSTTLDRKVPKRIERKSTSVELIPFTAAWCGTCLRSTRQRTGYHEPELPCAFWSEHRDGQTCECLHG